MMIPGDARITGAAGISRAYPAKTRSSAAAQKSDAGGRHFDSVTISENSGANTFAMELKSKLTQEVRTATSSDQIAAIREQVQNGTYEVDAREIAKKMLLMA